MAAGRPRSFDESEVLEQATQVFWSQGFEATSVAALEQATGLGRQSLYNAFGGKRALFLACLAHYEQTRACARTARLDAAADPLAAVMDLVQSWSAAARASGCRGCLLLNTLSEFGGRDPELMASVERVLVAEHAALAGALGRARDAGRLAPDIDPVALARRLQATAQGLRLMARLDPEGAAVEEVVADTLRTLRRAERGG